MISQLVLQYLNNSVQEGEWGERGAGRGGGGGNGVGGGGGGEVANIFFNINLYAYFINILYYAYA